MMLQAQDKLLLIILEWWKKSKERGQSILEVIVAMAIFSLIGAAMAAMAVGGFQGLEQGGEHTQAEALAQEGIEAVRSIRDGAWNEIIYSTSSVATSSGQWVFSGEGTTEQIGQFTRTISFSNVCRDASDDITGCPGTYTDIQNKKVTVTVSWEIRDGVTNSVQRIAYLTNWDSQEWTQTDWSGGSGQTTWSDSTKYDSDDGKIDNNSIAGEVKLVSGDTEDDGFDFATDSNYNWLFTTAANYAYDSDKIEVTGGYGQLKFSAGGSSGETIDDGFEYTTDISYDWPFTTAGNYTYDSAKIEVTGGVAQLKAVVGGTCSGTATACSSFGAEGTCQAQQGCSWDPADCSGTPTACSGQGEGTCSTCDCSWTAGSCFNAGACSGCSKNPACLACSVYGCSWDKGTCIGTLDCSSAGDQTSCTTCTQCSWSVEACNGTPSVCTAHSSESPCTNCGCSWDPADCSGTPTACTSFGDQTNCENQQSCSWSGGSYPTDKPDIYPTASYSAPGVQSWDSFTETASKNGGEIYYQLSDDDGTTWQYWTGAAWAIAATTTDSNTASDVNTNIGSFSTSTEQIKFRAFLESDGTQLVQLNNINIGLTPHAGVWAFSTWDVGGGEVTPTGTKQISGGNPNSYVDITVPSGSNDEVGGYWEQSFTTTINNPRTEIDFDYKVIDFNSSPDVAEIRIYVDTVSGSPSTQVGSSITISSEGSWIGATAIDASSAVTTTRTYYLKIAFWVETPGGGGAGPFIVGFDNVDLTWQEAAYPSDKPTIYPNNSFSTPGLDSWDSFTETASKDGGEIYYQLSDDDGTTWQYWNGSSWVVAGSTNYNTATVVNINISSFSTVNEQIKFKAFLESDGSQFVRLDNINIGATAPAAVWNFSTWDVDGGEEVPTGNHYTSEGNPGGYVDITISRGGNDQVGGYWEQSFKTYRDSPTPVTVDFDYKVIDFNDTPSVADIRVYIDSSSGEPTNQAGSSISVSGEGSWTSVATINAASAVPTASTHYLKIAFWLETPPGQNGPSTIGFDNVNIDLGNGEYPSLGYLVSSAFDTTATSSIQVIEWDETLVSGSDIKFQIRAATTQAGLSSESWSSYFNTAEGELISTDYNGNRWVQYKVSLSGDGTDTPVLEEARINYK